MWYNGYIKYLINKPALIGGLLFLFKKFKKTLDNIHNIVYTMNVR